VPELWGGLECTFSRIGDEFRDQFSYSGHYMRTDDIAKIASLNVSALRYPVLWELHQPSQHHQIDWRWTEQQLTCIRDNGIIPIVGLLHHGSGPMFTNLLDENFPEKFAEYAFAVAKKFPWISHYTPVNEPLTTARFSGLYGHWYPHGRDPHSFAKALFNQLKATVLAMKAIRQVNPEAKFVQTEDLAKIHSTRELDYQADFENHRRWVTFDVLRGMLTPPHQLWPYFLSSGINRKDLDFFIDNPCCPDVLGLNYYVTSERYLDHNIDAYEEPCGGNGRHKYVDMEAVRVGQASGIECLLNEVWDRYRLPMALTEVHLGCTCDEQIRWFVEMWNACRSAREGGVDIRAVTAWSLFGAYDWDSLLTKKQMKYECGAYDVSDGVVRLTNLGRAIARVGATGDFKHPILDKKGWWHEKAAKEILAA
jgi:dTDP-4-dehydrorhamnose reductase